MTEQSNLKVKYLLAFILILGAQCGVNSFVLRQPSFHNQCSLKESKGSVKCRGPYSDKFSLSYSINDKNGESDPRESEFSSLEPREENNLSLTLKVYGLESMAIMALVRNPHIFFTVRSTPLSTLMFSLLSSFYRNDQRYICR